MSLFSFSLRSFDSVLKITYSHSSTADISLRFHLTWVLNITGVQFDDMFCPTIYYLLLDIEQAAPLIYPDILTIIIGGSSCY